MNRIITFRHSPSMYFALRKSTVTNTSPSLRHYAKIVSKRSGGPTPTQNQLHRMRKILKKESTATTTSIRKPKEHEDQIFVAEDNEMMNAGGEMTTARSPPKSWKPDSASLRRMEERGLSFTSVLERGAERSITGREYTEDLTPQMREQCPLLTAQWDRYFRHFDQPELIVRAVTHKSYGTGKVPHNEQLAFMGKYVVEMCVTEMIVDKYRTQLRNVKEMNLVRAVYSNNSTLHLIGSYDWGLPSMLRCFEYEKMKPETKRHVMAGCVNAMIGAVYSNMGSSAARHFIQETLLFRTPSAIFTYLLYNAEPVQLLYDILFAQGFIIPKRIEDREGDVFSCSFYNHSQLIGYARASTAQEAATMAASNALAQMGARVPSH